MAGENSLVSNLEIIAMKVSAVYASSTNLLLAVVLACTIAACATTTSEPVLYPNDTYVNAGAAAANNDVQECMNLAEQYRGDQSRYTQAAKKGVIGGAVGAGTGALAGAIMQKNVGRATGAGAAVGSILGIAQELSSEGNHSPNYKEFVEHCLERKGYSVTGWR